MDFEHLMKNKNGNIHPPVLPPHMPLPPFLLLLTFHLLFPLPLSSSPFPLFLLLLTRLPITYFYDESPPPLTSPLTFG